MLPMYQAEAMWLDFHSYSSAFPYPIALKVATGKINAVNGAAWSQCLSADPQDYVMLPEQPWLDGYCIDKGVIRQFVAAPIEHGITVEEQVTGDSACGGIQLLAFPMKAAKYEDLRPSGSKSRRRDGHD